ncbi:MAG TPA: hypothetical protein VKR21_08620 [Solirubrobacteraceae bacterium]|nr:hypothetical protein [Solirubrobacteraceae bacterium]
MLRRLTPFAAFAALVLVLVPAASARVLLVGTYHGTRGSFSSIQAAVDAAKPGDWILIGPGDYKTSSIRTPRGGGQFPAGILISKPGLHLRGMNRNRVIVDGTRPGSSACSRKRAAQNFGPRRKKQTEGLNGIMVWKADNVAVQNLTVCNFLGGSGGDGVTGNEVWWNGGSGSGKIGGWGFSGSYLNTTNTFFKGERTAARYGIFASNWSGGTWTQDYASNFNDSGFYIGACRQICDNTVNHVWAQYSALGYSGSNSGGRLVIENSQFDHNKDGFDTNSQNGDNPPPQNGACPHNGISPITHTHSCWVFMNNYVHDNNNPNVPQVGAAASGPVGTGMSVSGGRNDTIMNNRFVRNDAWGLIVLPYVDSGKPCRGGTLGGLGPGTCLYDDWGDAVVGNTFSGNGTYGHPSNGDIAWLNLEGGHPTPCFSANTELGGGPAVTSPSDIERTHPACDGSSTAANQNLTFLPEVLCNSGISLTSGPPPCPSGRYPRAHGAPPMRQLPRHLPSMPNPCTGVPANPWCPARR